jgi:hypothetical protein
MKLVRKILIRFLLISAVLFCYGLNMYSSDFSNPYCIEFSDGNSNAGDCVVSHIDSFIDDQIPQTDNYRLISEAQTSMPVITDTFIFPDSYLRIWQPPKI